MSRGNSEGDATPAERSRAFDRLVNFTDAVVAIALTLQLLPLIGIAGPKPGETVWQIIADNWGQIFAFLLSFVIVVVMWTVHNRVFNVLRMYDNTILWLNLAWMLAIAFLPWPTAMYGTAGNSTDIGAGGVGLLYWLNLAVISGLGSLIAYHAAHHPELLEPGASTRGWLQQSPRARLRGAVITSYFVVIGVISEFIPQYAGWIALGLIPLGRILRDRPIPPADPAVDSRPNPGAEGLAADGR
jgi:uncharacterized membrane protein